METKKWYQSVGIWGGVIAFISVPIGIIFGVSLSADEQRVSADSITAIITGLVNLGGIGLGVYGRWKATREIK